MFHRAETRHRQAGFVVGPRRPGQAEQQDGQDNRTAAQCLTHDRATTRSDLLSVRPRPVKARGPLDRMSCDGH
jgi:hypothetical protein